VLVFAPFIYVPMIGVAILTPAVEFARSVKVDGQRLTPVQFGIAAAIACFTAVVAAAIGIWGARLLLARRTNRLATYRVSLHWLHVRGVPNTPRKQSHRFHLPAGYASSILVLALNGRLLLLRDLIALIDAAPSGLSLSALSTWPAKGTSPLRRPA
jgi:hypothetical protein